MGNEDCAFNLDLFFSNLGERFNKENDISDITYTFLISDDYFKEKFLKLLFDDIDVSKIKNIYREYSEDDSRPDFLIETEGKNYLIEVKKEDKNQHFDQYIKTFPDYKRAYITNYELGSEKEPYKNDYHFTTWKKIYNDLKSEKNDAIKNYLEYIKGVCIIMDIKDMRFNNLCGLRQFNEFVAKELLEKEYDGFELTIPSSDRSYWEDGFAIGASGKYFKLQKKVKKIKPWFGVFYTDTEVYICFSIELNKENKFIKDYIQEIKKDAEDFKYACDFNPYELWIFLDTTTYEKYQKTDDVEKQKEIIEEFFKNCLNIIGKYI